MYKKFIIFICIALGIYSIYNYLSPYLVTQENKELTNKYLSQDTGSDYLTIDFEKLQKHNSDIRGWITIPNMEDFSYPVMESYDNHEYLVTSFTKEPSEGGVPFIDIHCNKDLTDFNTIIYGHYTITHYLFGALYDYYQDETYNSYPYLHYYTLDNYVYIYQIVAIEEVEISQTNLFSTGYLNEDQKKEYIEEAITHSKYNYGIELTPNDHLLSLVCCTREVNDDYRLIVSFKFVNQVELK